MRGVFVIALSVLYGCMVAPAQIISEANLGCTAIAGGGMSCNGIGTYDPKYGEQKLPKLLVTHFIIEPGAVLERPSSSTDVVIIGINGGDLLNEKAPSLHVSLAKDDVTLMPKEQEFAYETPPPQTSNFGWSQFEDNLGSIGLRV
jgi:hypothetical protein